jgi:hypothetical protein
MFHHRAKRGSDEESSDFKAALPDQVRWGDLRPRLTA